MEKKVELTRDLLCESFIELMKTHPFEKITIKMITDGAGVIRPTFYNYYQDKIELLHYILEDRLFSQLRNLVETNMGKEAFKMLFYKLDAESDYYKNAFSIVESHYFLDVFTEKIRELMSLFFNTMHTKKMIDNISIETVTKYYALSLTSVLHYWLTEKDDSLTGDDLYKAYEFFLTNSIVDIIEQKKLY
ncbi:TetR/AcrR family transcriptional regulator [Peptoniphilus stercorisuis]|uniref:AcrR family transcriptional regulator n=1 Tax=Peptoniphilus stercorisuis TaxID=1436965 RepID=A0ABS4KD56_9FIRM|nr:TetR/AcrR family transcriptional regulator [Peptoniphilus stercorisuis]MBP2025719.1 AcrR family transcriptional regulator [Peptoniphilus stercorisuis]